MHIIIDYPERVKCNVCHKMMQPKKGKWDFVYLVKTKEARIDDGLAFPRCEDCAKKGD